MACNTLRVLKLNWNQILDEGLTAVALLIEKSNSLVSVDVSHCGGTITGRELCKKAAKKKKLKELCLV